MHLSPESHIGQELHVYCVYHQQYDVIMENRKYHQRGLETRNPLAKREPHHFAQSAFSRDSLSPFAIVSSVCNSHQIDT